MSTENIEVKFTLSKSVQIGGDQYTEVKFRPLTAGDVIAAREAAEKVYRMGEGGFVSTSQARLSIELLRRELVIGGISPVPLEALESLPEEDLLALEQASDTQKKTTTPE